MIRKAFTARLQKVAEKGGWTYVVMPFKSVEVFGRKGYIQVTGTVDGQSIAGSLMPLGDGTHMLAVRAAVRRAIGKEGGDEVRVELEPVEL